jgi:spore coat polysaccharide biosynthesis protein SpsF
MRLAILIQARMGSQRLPGKSLRDVAGRPMLAYVVERMQRCQTIRDVVVATSTSPEDDAIAAFCAAAGVECGRGPAEDVLARLLEIATDRGLDAFVRISGDSPLIDPELVDRGIRLFVAGESDLVTNVSPRSFPRGQSVEIVARQALARLSRTDRSGEAREHVTPGFYRRPDQFRITNFVSPRDLSRIQLSVDTPEDFADFSALVAAMRRPHWQYGLDEILALRDALCPRAERQPA